MGEGQPTDPLGTEAHVRPGLREGLARADVGDLHAGDAGFEQPPDVAEPAPWDTDEYGDGAGPFDGGDVAERQGRVLEVGDDHVEAGQAEQLRDGRVLGLHEGRDERLAGLDPGAEAVAHPKASSAA